VIYTVYRSYKDHGSNPIEPETPEALISDFDKEFIKVIYRKYKDYSASELVDKTHGESPYMNTDKDDVITQDSIKAYFSEKVYCDDKLFKGANTVAKLPAEDYNSAEDAEWEAYLALQ
jgi:uncharacterized phage-associated protein